MPTNPAFHPVQPWNPMIKLAQVPIILLQMANTCATLAKGDFLHPLFWTVIRRFICLNAISDVMLAPWVSEQADICKNTKEVRDISTKWISMPLLENPVPPTLDLFIAQIAKLVFASMGIWPNIYGQRVTSWSWKMLENFQLASMIDWNNRELISLWLTLLQMTVLWKVWKILLLPCEINMPAIHNNCQIQFLSDFSFSFVWIWQWQFLLLEQCL